MSAARILGPDVDAMQRVGDTCRKHYRDVIDVHGCDLCVGRGTVAFENRETQRILRERRRTAALRHAAEIAGKTVVECDIRDEDAARFVVETVDGRAFIGCAIHGAGGLLTHERRVLRRVEKMLEHGEPIRVYTLHTAATEQSEDIAADRVVRVTLVRGGR